MRGFLAAALAAALLTAGCSPRQPRTLTLATTTSTQSSGLLDVLVPRFRAVTGIEVKVVAVGTGQALELGRRGDADVLLVHDPDAEQRFMDEGFGTDRREVMHNDFVLIGPPADPAGVKGQTSAAEAFARIARRGSPFVSRGDESGTHQKEKAVWRQAGVEPRGDWYLSAGGGMGQVLRLASEKRSYTLSDRGTFLALRQGLDLPVLVEGDPLLVNPYHVISVNPAKHPHVHRGEAQEFADFLLSPGGKDLIGDFGRDRFGQPLFFLGAGGPGTGR
jgi:tungstate transport system substrate-binding protein